MSWLSDYLRKIGILPAYTVDDILNAEQENALRDVQKGKSAVEEQTQRQHLSTENLKRVMLDARSRVNQFAEFERRIREITRQQRRDVQP